MLAAGRNLLHKIPTNNSSSHCVGGGLKICQKNDEQRKKFHGAQGQMEQRAKLDSASEIPSPYDAVQLDLKGNLESTGAEEAPLF